MFSVIGRKMLLSISIGQINNVYKKELTDSVNFGYMIVEKEFPIGISCVTFLILIPQIIGFSFQ